ncbi:MAG: OmpA family protein [Bacteroidota bacterium]
MKTNGSSLLQRSFMRDCVPFFFLLLACFTFTVGYAQKPEKKRSKKRSALKKAKEHLTFEEYQQAIPHVQELLEQDAQNAYYNFWMGKALYLTYRKNQSLPYFDVANEINPDVDQEFHYYYALALHYNLKFEDAIVEYRRDLERYEPDSEEWREINARISQCRYAQKISERKEPELVKIKNMGDRINTEYAEHSPVISADNTLLVFTARRPDSRGAQPEADYYDEDIYISRNKGGEWSEAQNIGLPVNSKGHDATISITADGKRLYIYRHKKDGKLYVTDFDDAGNKWQEPRAVQKPLNSGSYEASICQSADSSRLFFTSDRPGGYGGLDIYMVKREGKDWGEPMNLGPRINTPFNEDAPYFHPDGKTLYFSSNGPNGMGGYDIFVTEMTPNEEFRPPINVGPPINTPDDEIYFVIAADGKTGYYASGKEGGMGEKDIYQAKFPYFHYPKRLYTVEVSGIVQDANSLDTIPSIVRLIDVEEKLVVDSMHTEGAIGRYSFAVEPERTYSLEVFADGYDAVSDSFMTPQLKQEDVYLERNLFVKRIEIPVAQEEAPEIQNIYFDFDEAELRSTAERELDLVAEILERNDNLELEIFAHTDWYGTYEYNVDLSEARASAAESYLLKKGLDAERIRLTWYSENVPLETNENDLGRQYNRRVEFHFIGQNGNTILRSRKLRTGSEAPYVDTTPPKGIPSLDNLGGMPAGTGNRTAVAGGVPNKGSMGGFTGRTATNRDAIPSDENPSATAETPEGLSGIRLENVYFDFDKSSVRKADENGLDRIVDILASNPDYKLVVKGHTDAFGSNDYNLRLSVRRCEAVYAYLMGIGVPENRMSFSGFSEDQPIAQNSDERGRQLNRRVEFEIRLGNKVVLRSAHHN